METKELTAKLKEAAKIAGVLLAGAAAFVIGVGFIWLCDAVGFAM